MPSRGRGAAALREPEPAHRAHRPRRPRARRQADPQGPGGDRRDGRGQPRSRAFPRPRPARLRPARTTGTWPSAGPRTSASARRWRGSRRRSPSRRCCAACPTCSSPEQPLVWRENLGLRGLTLAAARPDRHEQPRSRRRGSVRRVSRTTRRSTTSSPSSSPTACLRRSAGASSWTTRCGRASRHLADRLGAGGRDGPDRRIAQQHPVGLPARRRGGALRERALLGGTAGVPRLRDHADGRVLRPGAAGRAREREGGLGRHPGVERLCAARPRRRLVPSGIRGHPVPRLRARGPQAQAGPRRRRRGGGAGGGRRTAPQGQADRHGPRRRTAVLRVLRVPILRRAVRRVLA